MHFRHRKMDRQTDTDIVAKVRDVYITSCAKKRKNVISHMSNFDKILHGGVDLAYRP